MKKSREVKEKLINDITKISFEKLFILTDEQIDEMYLDLFVKNE